MTLKRYLLSLSFFLFSFSINAYLDIYRTFIILYRFPGNSTIILTIFDVLFSRIFLLRTETSSQSLVDRRHRSRMHCDTSLTEQAVAKIFKIAYCICK